MTPPSEKKLNRMSPNILKHGIPKELMRQYEGKKFDGYRERCDRCGSSHIQKFGFEKRTYAKAILQQQSGFHDVDLEVRKYRCVDCHHVMVCDEELFYPGLNYGKGIVDACLFLASSNPYNRVESMMQDHGIQVDLQSVRRYAMRFGKEAVKKAPLKFMGQNLDIGANLIKILFDKEDTNGLREEHPDEKHDGVTDETYPSVKGSKKEHLEDNRTRKALGEKQERFGNSFTLASSYLHNLRCFASLIVSLGPFNQILAEALLKVLDGCDYILSDGSYIYNGLVDERCLWHFMKNFFNKMDDGLMAMKDAKMFPWIVSQHMHDVYSMAKEEYVRYLMEKYPQFVATMRDGTTKFVGATTTNSMEGGNWRVKYELRVPYLLPESVFARALLIELRDSLYTFRNGHPEESFAHENGVFSYSRVMASDLMEDPPPMVEIDLASIRMAAAAAG